MLLHRHALLRLLCVGTVSHCEFRFWPPAPVLMLGVALETHCVWRRLAPGLGVTLFLFLQHTFWSNEHVHGTMRWRRGILGGDVQGC